MRFAGWPGSRPRPPARSCPVHHLPCSSRPATGGRPGDGHGARPDRADRRFRMLIATSKSRTLRQPLESAQYAACDCRDLLANGIVAAMRRKGNCRDNAPMESCSHTLKTVRVAPTTFAGKRLAGRCLPPSKDIIIARGSTPPSAALHPNWQSCRPHTPISHFFGEGSLRATPVRRAKMTARGRWLWG